MWLKNNGLSGDEELKEKGRTKDCGYPSENAMVRVNALWLDRSERTAGEPFIRRQHEKLLKV